MMKTIPIEIFEKNLEHIRGNIKGACEKSRRDPQDVRIMAVTKSFPGTYVTLARQGGISLFGESRVREAGEKFEETGDVELHLIGHLQRNKAGIAARLFSWVQSIDKFDTALALEKHAEILDKNINILIEINTTSEDSKYGIRDKDDYWRLMKKLESLSFLTPRGLMTVGPFTSEKDRITRSFDQLRELFMETKTVYPDLCFDTLSMGMSSDYEIAVEHGSTLVRIGTALFGERSYL